MDLCRFHRLLSCVLSVGCKRGLCKLLTALDFCRRVNSVKSHIIGRCKVLISRDLAK